MILVLAILSLGIGILALVAYGATPHGGPTTSCGPIDYLGQNFTIQADCRYVSVGELAIAVIFVMLAVFAALSARPRRPS